MKIVVHAGLFLIFCVVSVSTFAAPLCLKEEVLFSASINQFYPEISLEDYEVCPEYAKDIQNALEEILGIENALRDHFVSAFAFLIGERLLESVLIKDRKRGRAYSHYSFELAFKHKISAEEHLLMFEKK